MSSQPPSDDVVVGSPQLDEAQQVPLPQSTSPPVLTDATTQPTAALQPSMIVPPLSEAQPVRPPSRPTSRRPSLQEVAASKFDYVADIQQQLQQTNEKYAAQVRLAQENVEREAAQAYRARGLSNSEEPKAPSDSSPATRTPAAPSSATLSTPVEALQQDNMFAVVQEEAEEAAEKAEEKAEAKADATSTTVTATAPSLGTHDYSAISSHNSTSPPVASTASGGGPPVKIHVDPSDAERAYREREKRRGELFSKADQVGQLAPPRPEALPRRSSFGQSGNSDEVLEVLDWSNKGLRHAGVEGGWALYPTIHTLILRDNELTTIVKQGLESLPNLVTLDLRRNKLTSFGDTLIVLSQCRSLKHVYLHQSTRDNITNQISLYTDFVFQSLRGLETCDDVQSQVTIRLNPLDQSAFEFIHLLSGGMSENQLLRCDLSNRHLPAHLFFFILSALYQLKVAWLKMDGANEWSTLNSYSNCVIFYLGKHLLYLDEEEITHQRLHLALKAQAESKIKIVKLSWEEVADEALEAAREYCENLEHQRHEHEQQLASLAASTAAANNLNGGASIAGDGTIGSGAALALDARSVSPDESENGGAGGNGAALQKNQMPEDGVGIYNLHIPGRGLMAAPLPGAATANSISTHSSNVGIDTQLSNKLEILIHYLQVYGLVLLSALKIDWPDAFYQFSEWVRTFALNFETWFNWMPFQRNILFWTASFFPLALVILFWRISALRGNLDKWIDTYVTHWSATKWTALAIYMTFVVIGIATAILFMGEPVYSGGTPNSSNITAACSFLVFPTLIFFVWYLAIRAFRFGYHADRSVDKDKFRGDWLSRINLFQWLCLFLITNTFMPVSRVILGQFACTCDGKGEINRTQRDPDICYAAINSSMRCFPHDFTATQVTAFVLGLVYLIGIPSFYYTLISRTVALVLSTSRQYKLLRLEVLRLEALPKAQRRLFKEDLAEYKRIQHKLYWVIVNNPLNSVPASSLFAAYQEKYKYTKLFQMFQKVLLVLITLFVPDHLGPLDYGAKIIWAAICITLYLVTLLLIRPYNDPLDDAMDIIAEAGNTTNIFVIMSLAYQAPWLSDRQANILLFTANGVILASFVMAFIISPAKTYWRRRKLRETVQQEQALEEEKIKLIMEGVDRIKTRRKSAEAASGAEMVLLKSDEKGTLGRDTLRAVKVAGPMPHEYEKEDDSQAAIGMTLGGTLKDSHIVRIHDDEESLIEGDREDDGASYNKTSRATDSLHASPKDHLGLPTPLARSPQSQEGQPPPETTHRPMHIHVSEHSSTQTPAAPISLGSGRDNQPTSGRPRAFSGTSTPHLDASGNLTRSERTFWIEQPTSATTNANLRTGRSISATLPVPEARAIAPLLGGSYGRYARRSTIARPSLATLAELFSATSPPPVVGDSLPQYPPAEPSPSRQTAEERQAELERALSGADESYFAAPGEPGPGVERTHSLPESDTLHERKMSAAEEAEFATHFHRSSTDLSRMKQLALLKLCSPANKAHLEQLNPNSGGRPAAFSFGTATPGGPTTPASTGRASVASAVGISRTTPVPMPIASATSAFPPHHRPRKSSDGGNEHGSLRRFTGEHSVPPPVVVGSPPPRPHHRPGASISTNSVASTSANRPTVECIDVSLSPRAYIAPVVVSPRAAALLDRLEQTEGARIEREKEASQIHSAGSLGGTNVATGATPAPNGSPSVVDSYLLPPTRMTTDPTGLMYNSRHSHFRSASFLRGIPTASALLTPVPSASPNSGGRLRAASPDSGSFVTPGSALSATTPLVGTTPNVAGSLATSVAPGGTPGPTWEVNRDAQYAIEMPAIKEDFEGYD